ncbi:MAG TPA: phosphohistidine phosphatase SixA [Candidatus Binatia bacterium]|jgi:phosphohistidine phosphatase|nr:phosphohistidine phosphatase SixA [Candidatus Binatia bacterium]
MNFYVLRHGLAVEPGTPGYKDSERPLTPKGERKLWRITEAMAAMDLSFDLIVCSPYLRARQTAGIVAEAFDTRKKLEFSEALAPAGSPKELLGWLNHRKPSPENVLLVGHEPYLSELISLLVSGDAGFSVTMKKGGLCKLSLNSVPYGRCATLEWLLTPKQMALMGLGLADD